MAQATNTNGILSIPALAGAVDDDCTVITGWDAEVAGALLFEQAISTDPDPLVLGDRYEIAAGTLVIDQPAAASETAAFAQRGVRGKITDGVWIQFHTGAPGDGTANVIAELGRVQITEADWTVT